MLNMISVLELINVWTYFSNNIDKENKKHDRVNKKTNSKIVCKLIKWKKNNNRDKTTWYKIPGMYKKKQQMFKMIIK